MSQRYEVTFRVAEPRSMAAVRARLPIGSVPARFANYLNQVYTAARDGPIKLDGQNIFVYRDVGSADGDVDVEFGVGVVAPFVTTGPVRYSRLPEGQVATTTHWGTYAGLGDAHAAVIARCRELERSLTGTRWEVYGHWSDDPTQVRTDVYYLLEPSA